MTTDQLTLCFDEPQEEWRPIPGYEGFYEVSSLGRIKGVKRPGGKGGILKQHVTPKGYAMIGLHVDGHLRTASVHSLVMIAFVGPRPLGLEVNHINFKRADNRVSNLEYVTGKDNTNHSHGNYMATVPGRTGDGHWSKAHPERIVMGEKQGLSKLKESDIIEIRRMRKSGMGIVDIAKIFHVDHTNISCITLRKTWKHVP